MKETNDKIVQGYIERAYKITETLSRNSGRFITNDDIIEIAKMIQLEDLHSRDKMSFLDYQDSLVLKGTQKFKGYPEEVYPPQVSLKSDEQRQLEQQSNQK